MKYLFAFSIYFLFISKLISQVSFTSSDLPIIVVNTNNGLPIVDDPKIEATIGIIYNGEGERNTIFDARNEYFGKCGIEIRGESSQLFAKQSFLFETWDEDGNDIDTSFLGFPKEEDFILYGPYSDKTMMNNVLAMHLANEMGHYSSRTRFVEVVINDNYRGIYVLMEKIKRDKNRVDIAKLNEIDIEGDQLTGGYIIRIDKGFYDGWASNYNAHNSFNSINFQYYYPDQNTIQSEQKSYIKSYVDNFENAIASNDGYNDDGLHYTHYINLRSFVDNFLLNELSKDVDAYRLSTYFHKDKDSKGGRLTAGPFWDFNLSFGNADYCQTSDPSGLIYYQCGGNSPFWWNKWLNDITFLPAMKCRWEELRETILNENYLNTYLEDHKELLAESQVRNFTKFTILGQYIWPNPLFFQNAPSHAIAIDIMKDWLNSRIAWLDNNLPGFAVGCDKFDDPNFEVMMEVSTSDLDLQSINVFPNPTADYLQISSNEIIGKVVILDIFGNRIKDYTFDTKSEIIDLRNLVSGSYILRSGKRIVSNLMLVKL